MKKILIGTFILIFIGLCLGMPASIDRDYLFSYAWQMHYKPDSSAFWKQCREFVFVPDTLDTGKIKNIYRTRDLGYYSIVDGTDEIYITFYSCDELIMVVNNIPGKTTIMKGSGWLNAFVPWIYAEGIIVRSDYVGL